MVHPLPIAAKAAPTRPFMPLSVTVAHFSATGPRARNEDFTGCVTPHGADLANKGFAAVVADGRVLDFCGACDCGAGWAYAGEATLAHYLGQCGYDGGEDLAKSTVRAKICGSGFRRDGSHPTNRG